MIFNRTLTATEISTLYNATVTQYQNNFTNLADGEHNFIGHAVDLVGNLNSTETRSVSIDTTPPTITIDYPTNGATVTTSYVNITGTASDANPDNITINLTIFGTNLGTFTNWNFTNITMADGTYSVKVTAADSAGNEAADEVTFTVSTDFTAPEVFILSPQNITYPNGTINFNATVLEENPDSGLVQVTPDGQGATNYTLVNASGIWGYTNASMPDGVYRAEFFLNDTAGNINFTESVVFTIDTVAPTISIEYPTGGETLNITYLNITGIASDTNPSTITINDTRFGSNLGSFTSFNFTNTSLADGTYSVQVTATDAAGNNATDDVTFTINQFAITGCRELDTENAVYTLLNDIFTTTTCFNITANNVTLDLNHKNISGDRYADATIDAAVWNSGYNDSTVMNGNFYDFVYGIFHLNVWRFNITKINVTGNAINPGSSLGMFIDASGNGSITHNNASNLNSSSSFIPRASGKGIDTRKVNNTIIRDNIANDNKDDGLTLSGNNITALNNTANDNQDIGIQISARDSLIQNNTANRNGIITENAGIRFAVGADRNTVRDNVLIGNSIGILIGQADNNTIFNTIIKNSTFQGVELFLLSTGNTIDTLIIDNTTGDAFHMSSSTTDNNTLRNVNITGTKIGFADLKIATSGIDNLTIEDSNINNYSITTVSGGRLGLIIKSAQFGEIFYLSPVNGSGPNLTQEIYVRFNEANINSTNNPAVPGIDQSANITLLQTPGGGQANLVIRRNGISCVGSCFNFTPLTAATVIFSVPGEGNYSLGVDTSAPVISIDVNDTTISLFDQEHLKIDWNVTDDYLDTVRLNITAPNGTLFLETTDQFADVILFASNFSDTGNYNIVVYANDTLGNEVTEFAAFIVSPGNVPPTQTTPVIAPDPAFVDDTLRCSTTPTDSESVNLSVFFVWYLNGQQEISTFENVATENNTLATGTLVWPLVKGQSWICLTQTNDGSGGSVVENSSAVVIQNSPPFVSIPETFNTSIAPAGVFDLGDMVVIKVNVTDVDGQGDLDNARINITDSSPLLRVSDSLMTPLESITNGFMYGFNYTISVTETAGGAWTVDVTATDIDEAQGTNTTTFVVIIPVPGVHSFVITMTLNNTDNTVFIPGVGEQASLGIGPATYTSPPAFFLASYLNNNLKGLVFSLNTPTSLGVDSAAGKHALILKQDLPNSQVFMVFTRGDYQTIDREIRGIDAGEFLEAFWPSFAYGPGFINTVTVFLEYAIIDIRGDFDFKDQDRRLIVEDIGREGDKEIIKIEVV